MPAQDPPSLPTTASPSLPSPQAFSILPEVHTLLLRLQASTSENPLDASAAGLDGSPQQQPLLLKDLPSAAAQIRVKIAKAKATVDTIPDIERTIGDQEKEIKMLEERVARLKNVLGGGPTRRNQS